MNKKTKRIKLDPEEKEPLASVERGECITLVGK